MVSANQIRTAVGIISNVISLVLFLSPLPTFYQICKKKSVEHFFVVPYVAMLLNYMLWVLYGMPFVKPNSTLIITINGAGTVIELICIFIYLLYLDGSRWIKAHLLLFTDIAFIVIVAVIVAATNTHYWYSMNHFLHHNVCLTSLYYGTLRPCSNAIGLLFAIAQLLLHAIYNKSTKRQSNEGKSEVNVTH